MDRDKIRYRKIEILDERKAKNLTQKQLERRCFWTWPLGHLWNRDPNLSYDTCMVCGAQRQIMGPL